MELGQKTEKFLKTVIKADFWSFLRNAPLVMPHLLMFLIEKLSNPKGRKEKLICEVTKSLQKFLLKIKKFLTIIIRIELL